MDGEKLALAGEAPSEPLLYAAQNLVGSRSPHPRRNTELSRSAQASPSVRNPAKSARDGGARSCGADAANQASSRTRSRHAAPPCFRPPAANQGRAPDVQTESSGVRGQRVLPGEIGFACIIPPPSQGRGEYLTGTWNAGESGDRGEGCVAGR